MKYFLITALYCALFNQAHAQISSNDLPYLEGTPITIEQGDGAGWTLLDSAQTNGQVQWAWLEHLGARAYVIYPTPTASITFPDGKTINADPQQVVMLIVGAPQVEFTRFGGKVVLEGAEVAARYWPTPRDNSLEGISYSIANKSIFIAGIYSGTLTTAGAIRLVQGTIFADSFVIDGLSSTVIAGMGGDDQIITPQPGTVTGSLCQSPNPNPNPAASVSSDQTTEENSQLCTQPLQVVAGTALPTPGSLTVHLTPPTVTTTFLPDTAQTSGVETQNPSLIENSRSSAGHDQAGIQPIEVKPNTAELATEPRCIESSDKSSPSAQTPPCSAPVQRANEPDSPVSSTPPSAVQQAPESTAANQGGKSKGGSIDWAFGAALLLLGMRKKRTCSRSTSEVFASIKRQKPAADKTRGGTIPSCSPANR